jgi:hypothetical protein
MKSYIPESPLHYALNYIPFNYSIDPDWGLIAFLKTTSEYIKGLKTDSPSFDFNAKWFCIESEESHKTFGIIENWLDEFIFGMMDREVFDIISTRLNLTIYQKRGDIRTSRFSANEFFSILESMIRQILIDQVLEELD